MQQDKAAEAMVTALLKAYPEGANIKDNVRTPDLIRAASLRHSLTRHPLSARLMRYHT